MILSMKGTLVFDGDCHFCRMWIERWREDLEPSTEIVPYQHLGDRFERIDRSEFESALHFIDNENRVFVGAAALFQALKVSGTNSILWSLYSKVPGLAVVLEFFYRIVARRRRFASKVTHLLVGNDLKQARYERVRRVFFRGLFSVFAIAFASIWTQIHGLIGEDGIKPASLALEPFIKLEGFMRYLWKPGLGWLATDDKALFLYCGLGLAFSLVGFLRWQQVCAAICFFIYLSLVHLSEPFMSYQWDALLLEMSFLSIFWFKASGPGIVWLYRFLAFKLMFSSGAVKLASGDRVWGDLSALKYHFWTQPLPNPVAYFADKLPDLILMTLVLLMFVVELGVPFLIFCFRKPRVFAFFIMAFTQLAFMFTGNFTFFNILSVVLFVPLLDDRFLKLSHIRKVNVEKTWLNKLGEHLNKLHLRWAGGLFLFVTGLFSVFNTIGATQFVPDNMRYPMALVRHLGVSSSYGLFAVMTKERNEIMVEGSEDGKTWKRYLFKHKPDSLYERPNFVAPHQPRLDWQMWFASLSQFSREEWLQRFVWKLLQGSGVVLNLLDENPFPDAPPKYIRLIAESYMFSSLDDLEEGDLWWEPFGLTLYSPVLTLDASGSLSRANIVGN